MFSACVSMSSSYKDVQSVEAALVLNKSKSPWSYFQICLVNDFCWGLENLKKP